ncbi:hypothetical protein BH09BAC2_BH09BAC2_22500 [soil metagenome]
MKKIFITIFLSIICISYSFSQVPSTAILNFIFSAPYTVATKSRVDISVQAGTGYVTNNAWPDAGGNNTGNPDGSFSVANLRFQQASGAPTLVAPNFTTVTTASNYSLGPVSAVPAGGSCALPAGFNISITRNAGAADANAAGFIIGYFEYDNSLGGPFTFSFRPTIAGCETRTSVWGSVFCDAIICNAGQNLNTALPVTLISFNGQPSGSDVKLAWVTSNEFNSKEFQLERSTDGANFSGIGIIRALGNSNTDHTYNFVDAGILNTVSADYVYYRLKVLDIDNRGKYHPNIVKLKVKHNGGYDASLMPNITSASTSLSLSYAQADNNVMIRIFDIAGKLMETKKISAVAGTSTFSLNVSSYPAGMYNVQVQSANLTKTLKLVKSN